MFGDAVDEQTIRTAAEPEHRLQLALADHLDASACRDPLTNERRQRVRLEGQPRADWKRALQFSLQGHHRVVDGLPPRYVAGRAEPLRRCGDRAAPRR